MKKKVAYFIIAAVGLTAASIWSVSRNTWSAVSWDGFSDPERGVGVAMTTWNAMHSGAHVEETISTYSSLENARLDFQVALKGPGEIIDTTNAANSSSGDPERAVKFFGNRDTREGDVEIITRRNNKLRFISGGSLKVALAFEQAWVKLE